jgi:hypothetical protein
MFRRRFISRRVARWTGRLDNTFTTHCTPILFLHQIGGIFDKPCSIQDTQIGTLSPGVAGANFWLKTNKNAEIITKYGTFKFAA